MSTQHSVILPGVVQTPGPTLDQMKQTLFRNIGYRLGSGIVDLELDNEHWEAAYAYAIAIYRQKAQNATRETYTLMTLIKDVDTYTLPQEYANVRSLFRRNIGMETGPGSNSFDPFSSAIMNTYLLNYNAAGGLATYDFYAQYVELTARMFGGYIIFTFDPATKVLRIVRNYKGGDGGGGVQNSENVQNGSEQNIKHHGGGERILVWADMWRSEDDLLKDPGAGVWLGNYILGTVKVIIGEAREKFGSIPGPGGGTSLNGAAMKAEGKEIQQACIEEIHKYGDHSQPVSFIIG